MLVKEYDGRFDSSNGNSALIVFYATNGVKQGGIISPILVNVYMDDLSISLNNSDIGDHVGEKP